MSTANQNSILSHDSITQVIYETLQLLMTKMGKKTYISKKCILYT